MKQNAPLCSYSYTDIVSRALLLGLASNLNVKDVSLDLSCCEVRPDFFSSAAGNLFILFNEQGKLGAICGLSVKKKKNCSRLFHITGRLFMQLCIWIYSGIFRAVVSETRHSSTFQCRLGLLKIFHCPQVWPVCACACIFAVCLNGVNATTGQGCCIPCCEDVRLMVGFSWHLEMFPNSLAALLHSSPPRSETKKQAASADWMGWLKITHEYKLHRKSNSSFPLKSSQTEAAGGNGAFYHLWSLNEAFGSPKTQWVGWWQRKVWTEGGEICRLCLCMCVCQRGVIIKHLRVLLLQILGCGSDMLFSPLMLL